MTASRPPLVTLALVVANLFAAFALVVNPDLAVTLGFRPDAPSVLTTVTSLFLHANVFHLLGNLVFLAAVGGAVEVAAGRFRYLSVYLLSGVAGVLLHYLMVRGMSRPAPYIGASGAVAGLVAYYAFRYQAMRVPVVPHLALPVVVVTGVWLALQALGALVRIGEVGGTSFWAHLGGFGMGLLLSLVFRAPDLGDQRTLDEGMRQVGEKGPVHLKTAAQARLKGMPKDPRMLRELADACRQLGDDNTESHALVKLVDLLPDKDVPQAIQRLARLNGLSEIPGHRRLALAERLANDAPEEARLLLNSAYADATLAQRPDLLLAMSGFERGKNDARASELAETLAREFPLHPAADLARKRGWVS
ncbi:hypothetical protein BH11ARM2_BH11ARM2_38190 [soil metagenome]